MNDALPVVLVVDDERGLADLYAAWLADEYTTRVAYGGESAIDLLDDTVDVVLLDRRMPGYSGDAVLEAIEDRNLDCRVAMVTAVEPDFDIIEMGFDEYLHKPVSQDDLREVVESLLDRQQYEATLSELFSLVAKRETLADQKSDAELADNPEFRDLEARIRDLESETHALVSEMDSYDAAKTLRGLNVGIAGDADE